MPLGERKLQILKVIIDDYIHTAQPVGSRSISKKPMFQVSSATIRNEMADLEELGYLLQPHTSAGRVPSDLGYRIYVDMLRTAKKVASRDKKIIQSLLVSSIIEVDDIIFHAMSILSELTQLPVVITLPLFKKSKLENMKLIRVNSSKVLLIMVSDTGVIKNIRLGISDISQDILDKIASCILNRFKGTAIESIGVKQLSSLREELSEYSGVIDYLIPILRDSLKEVDKIEVYTDGVDNIFLYEEFSNLSNAKQVISLMKDKDLLYDAVSDASDGLSVKIGEENRISAMKKLSLVASPYKFNGKNDGRIAVIGPTRIAYDSIIPTVQYISDVLSSIFSGISL